ncbi:MAG: site-specific DNA-methyltransferase [Dehalococcoidia bacterium]
MKKLTPEEPETHSTDVVAENVDRLRELFPEAFTEGRVDFEVLKQLLGGHVDEREEKYGLNWHGKRRARQLALTPSKGTLRPCPDESVDWETTQNLMIEGDNLEVLKLLQKSYAGKVKLIYIDPPYNTGKDFVYPDDFRDSIRNYLFVTGQVDGENGRVSSNTEASGRFHTDWLNMMYPRLKLARTLLRDDGLLVTHIDEHERATLHLMLSDLFGEENFLGEVIWDKRNPKGDARGIAYQHESLLLFARDSSVLLERSPLRRPKRNAASMLSAAKRCTSSSPTIEDAERTFREWLRQQPDLSGGEAMYNRLSSDGRVYRLVSMAWPNKNRAPDDYFEPLLHPRTQMPCPVPARGWRNPPATMRRLLDGGLIEFGADESTQPQRRYFLDENMLEGIPSIVAHGASDDSLFTSWDILFSNPKPVAFATQVVSWLTSGSDLVLDFFAGSGTVGHATWNANSQDGNHRRFVLVQLPEPVDDDNSSTIADLTRSRLCKSRQSVQETASQYSGDLGFRVFKLDHSNIRAWDQSPDDLDGALFDAIQHLRDGRTEHDVLYELLLKLGLDLCVPIEQRSIAGKTVHSVGAGTLFVCLPNSVESVEVEPLALGIAAWHEELAPAGETTVVFRDSAFENDVAKTNLAAILQQHGLENVRSL